MRGVVGERLRVSGASAAATVSGLTLPRDGRPVGLLPALELVGEHGQRAAEADDVDQRGKGEAQRRMAGQHGAHEVRRQKRRACGALSRRALPSGERLGQEGHGVARGRDRQQQERCPQQLRVAQRPGHAAAPEHRHQNAADDDAVVRRPSACGPRTQRRRRSRRRPTGRWRAAPWRRRAASWSDAPRAPAPPRAACGQASDAQLDAGRDGAVGHDRQRRAGHRPYRPRRPRPG